MTMETMTPLTAIWRLARWGRANLETFRQYAIVETLNDIQTALVAEARITSVTTMAVDEAGTMKEPKKRKQQRLRWLPLLRGFTDYARSEMSRRRQRESTIPLNKEGGARRISRETKDWSWKGLTVAKKKNTIEGINHNFDLENARFDAEADGGGTLREDDQQRESEQPRQAAQSSAESGRVSRPGAHTGNSPRSDDGGAGRSLSPSSLAIPSVVPSGGFQNSGSDMRLLDRSEIPRYEAHEDAAARKPVEFEEAGHAARNEHGGVAGMERGAGIARDDNNEIEEETRLAEVCGGPISASSASPASVPKRSKLKNRDSPYFFEDIREHPSSKGGVGDVCCRQTPSSAKVCMDDGEATSGSEDDGLIRWQLSARHGGTWGEHQARALNSTNASRRSGHPRTRRERKLLLLRSTQSAAANRLGEPQAGKEDTTAQGWCSTSGSRSLQFGWGSGSSFLTGLSSSSSSSSGGAQRGPCFRCPLDLKVLCRLVGLHNLRDKVAPKSKIALKVDGIESIFEVLSNVCIGQNVRCLVFRQTCDGTDSCSAFPRYLQNVDRVRSGARHDEDVDKSASNAGAKEEGQQEQLTGGDSTGGSTSTSGNGEEVPPVTRIIFAFNWFSPQKVADYLALGLKLLTAATELDARFGLCNKFSMDKALEFAWHPELRALLRRLKSGDVELLGSGGKSGAIATVCGFSMGGAIAHAFSYALVEEHNIGLPVRVVTFGSSRPGSRRYGEWCRSHLTADSIDLLLACEEEKALLDTRGAGARRGVGGSGGSRNTGRIPLMCSSFWDDAQGCTIEPDADEQSAAMHVKSVSKSTAYDPITRTPRLADGFDHHPTPYILLAESGYIMPMGAAERDHLRSLDNEYAMTTSSAVINALTRASFFDQQFSRLWKKLHSVAKYSEAMR